MLGVVQTQKSGFSPDCFCSYLAHHDEKTLRFISDAKFRIKYTKPLFVFLSFPSLLREGIKGPRPALDGVSSVIIFF